MSGYVRTVLTCLMSPPGGSTCAGTGFSYVRNWKYDFLNPQCLTQLSMSS